MARVVMQAVVSVDGYIALTDDTPGPMFDWYFNGRTALTDVPRLGGVRRVRPALLGRHQGHGDRPPPVRHH